MINSLEAILDAVEARKREVTIDCEGCKRETIDSIVAAAKARGLHAAVGGRFVLIRDLR